jgi:hypothetical protein
VNTPFERIFVDSLRHQSHAEACWRGIEGELINYLASHRVDIVDVAGEPHFEAVIFREGDEVTARKLSIERLARHLAELL